MKRQVGSCIIRAADFPAWEDILAATLHELLNADLIEQVDGRQIYRLSPDRGIALTELLKVMAHSAPPEAFDPTPPPDPNTPSLEYRPKEYSKEEMRKFLLDNQLTTAIQIRTKAGYRIIKGKGNTITYALKPLNGRYKFVRYLDLQRRSVAKSAEAVEKHVPRTQRYFRVTDRGMGTTVFNHRLEIVREEND